MIVQRGEIYFVDLNPVRGREQAVVRPALVLSVDLLNRLPLVVTVVPGTDAANVRGNYPSVVRVSPDESALPLETVFLCFQVRAVDPGRLGTRPAGRLDLAAMARIEKSIRYCLGV
jgi:mRNA interferase MazF